MTNCKKKTNIVTEEQINSCNDGANSNYKLIDEVKQKTEQTIEENQSQNEMKKAKTRTPVYRVLYDSTERVWVIKKDGAKRIIKKYWTKAEALDAVEKMSVNQEISFVVHKKDGKFQKK